MHRETYMAATTSAAVIHNSNLSFVASKSNDTMHRQILTSPFIVALKNGNHEELPGTFGDFKKDVSLHLTSTKVIWHHLHVVLIDVLDELEDVIETVKCSIVSFAKRAHRWVNKIIGHVNLMIENPPPTAVFAACEEPDEEFLALMGKSKALSVSDVIMLGRAIHEARFKTSGMTMKKFVVNFGKLFKMEISEAYIDSSYTDMKSRLDKSHADFLEEILEKFLEKIDKENKRAEKRRTGN